MTKLIEKIKTISAFLADVFIFTITVVIPEIVRDAFDFRTTNKRL